MFGSARHPLIVIGKGVLRPSDHPKNAKALAKSDRINPKSDFLLALNMQKLKIYQ